MDNEALVLADLQAENERLLQLLSEIDEYLDTDAHTTIACNSPIHCEIKTVLKELSNG